MQKPPVFTPDEIAAFRAEIARRRTPGAYQPGRWSVSPLNRDPAVVGVMPSAVRLRDSTLRSIEAMPGVVTTEAAKEDYIRQLVRAGVAEIVGAGPTRSLDDLSAEVAAVKAEDSGCRILCPLISSIQNIDKSAAAGFDGVQIWVEGFGETSQIYRRIYDSAWKGQDWRVTMPVQSRDERLAAAARLVSYARHKGLLVVTSMLMVSFLTNELLRRTVEVLVDAGADELTLFDGPGAVGPEAYAALVARVRELAPDVLIGLHPHNTFGLAVACAVAAARAGATVMELSVNGYCGGPGNAASPSPRWRSRRSTASTPVSGWTSSLGWRGQERRSLASVWRGTIR